MTQDIIEMAIQAGFFIDLGEICTSSSQDVFTSVHEELEAFAKLVAAKEREACLQIQEDWQYQYANDLVQKIRARGEA